MITVLHFFIKIKNCFLRSRYWDDAYCVSDDGIVGNNYQTVHWDSCGWKILYYSPAIDTIGDSVLYIEANGGSYITDYLSTYSYGAGGINSPDFDNLDYSAHHVEMDGSILGNWYVTGSYGNALRASVTTTVTVRIM